MAVLHNKLSEEKIEEIRDFSWNRMEALKTLRQPIDDEIEEEVDLYNDKDKNIEAKQEWEEKHTIPYQYTIVQTMVARLSQTFFGQDNHIKIFVEDEKFLSEEKGIEGWIQAEMDKVRFKDSSRDFIESALVKRTSWIQIRPVPSKKKKNKIRKVEYDVYEWNDVWFDTKARKTSETDFVVRKRMKMWELLQNEDHYFNLDKIKDTEPPDDIKERQQYEAETGENYYDPNENNVTDEVEVKEHYVWYDVSESEKKMDFKPCILSWANDEEIIRIETIETGFDNKFLIFPIRPMRIANSLIGKSVPQITKKMQYLLNEILSLGMDNYKLLVKLLFKYKKDGSIDFDELFAEGGNAVGYDEDPNDVSTFDVPNLVQITLGLINQVIQFMQQTTGAVDYVVGTNVGGSATETAKGIQSITEQALFKFSMMAENIYSDLKDVINYSMMFLMKYGDTKAIAKRYGIKKLMNVDLEEIEDSYLFDIAMNDLAQRRDIERAQFINAINIIGGMMQGINPTEGGANMKELLKQVMERFNMQNIDKILSPDPKTKKAMQQQQQMNAALMAAGGGIPPTGGGAAPVDPNAPNANALPDENAENPIPPV